jgi:Fe-S-cluster containining protein
MIAKLGHKKSYFVTKDSKNAEILNRVNGYCRFLEIKGGIATCAVYESRPRVCREYDCIEPGKAECKLQRHYSVIDFGKLRGTKNENNS